LMNKKFLVMNQYKVYNFYAFINYASRSYLIILFNKKNTQTFSLYFHPFIHLIFHFKI